MPSFCLAQPWGQPLVSKTAAKAGITRVTSDMDIISLYLQSTYTHALEDFGQAFGSGGTPPNPNRSGAL